VGPTAIGAVAVDEHISTPGRDTVAVALDFVGQEEDADARARSHGPGGGDPSPIRPQRSRVSLLAVDIGSSRVKAVLAGWDGRAIEVRSAPTPRQTTEPGEESYPVDLVYSTIEGLISGLMESYPSDRADTVVFSCLGTAMAPLDRDGRPLGAALAPTDARPMRGPRLDETVDMEASELVRRTGSDPAVASFLWHALWWQRQRPAVQERIHRFRSLRGYAVQELCGTDAEDRSWVSRTMLVDLETGGWSQDILDAAGLPASVLPQIESPTATFQIRSSVAARLGLAPRAVAVLGGMDNGCSLLGADGPERSGVANIVGTYEHMAGSASLAEVREVAAVTGAVVHAHVLPGRYLTMTRVPIGSLLADIADGHPPGLDDLMTAISDGPQGNTIALDPEAVAAALGEGRSRTSVVQAVVEAGAVVLQRFADAWERLGLPSSPVAAVGGGADQDAVLQLKADLLRRTFVTLQTEQAAGLGALRLAAMARHGLSAAEACAVFENPVRRTIQPRSITVMNETQSGRTHA
jgi:xylulokinase